MKRILLTLFALSLLFSIACQGTLHIRKTDDGFDIRSGQRDWSVGSIEYTINTNGVSILSISNYVSGANVEAMNSNNALLRAVMEFAIAGARSSVDQAQLLKTIKTMQENAAKGSTTDALPAQ